MSDTILELLETLLLSEEDIEEEQRDGYYVIELYDYDTFNSVYNKLEANVDAERDSDNSTLDIENIHITYIYKDILVELLGLLDEDDYTLNIYEEKTEE